VLLASANFGERYVLEWAGLVLVVAVIWWKVVPWLRVQMNAKQSSIKAQLAAGDEARAAAERIVAQRSAELEAARREAAAIVEQAKRSAAQIVEDGRTRGEDEYQRLVTRASTEIELARARSRDEVTWRIAGLVISAAEAVVEAELDTEMHHHLIDEAIAAAESEAR
jgi:F-type H+-transporting ATPase subunit b